MFFGKDKTEISLGKSKKVHGIEVRKQPIGQYIKTIKRLEQFPQTVIKQCFGNGADIDTVFDKFKNINEDIILELAGKMLSIIPEETLKFMASLLDVEYDYLLNNVSPAELLDIIEEFIKINDMSRFFETLKKLIARAKTVVKM